MSLLLSLTVKSCAAAVLTLLEHLALICDGAADAAEASGRPATASV